MSDSDSEKEADEEGLTLRCLRPGPTPEATLTVKKNRYVSWTADPAKVQRDIVSQQKSILGAKRQLSELGFQESHWRDCFEMARHRVNDSLLRVKEGNLSLNMVGKHIDSIYASRRAGGQGRRLAATLKDFGTALEESKDEIEEALNLYLCSDSSETDASTATRTRCVDVELNDSDLEVNAPSKTASGSLSMRASPIDAAAESVAIKAEPSPNLTFPGNRVKIEGSSLLMAYPSSSLIEANSWVCANCGLHNHCDPNQSHSAFNIMSKDLDPARSRRVCVSCHQVGDTLDFDGRALDGDNGEKNYDDNGVLKPSKRPSSSSTAERMSLKQYMIKYYAILRTPYYI